MSRKSKRSMRQSQTGQTAGRNETSVTPELRSLYTTKLEELSEKYQKIGESILASERIGEDDLAIRINARA